MDSQIKKQIELKAPLSRVWKALVDHKQFGEWFRVHLEAPFETGKAACGRILHPGYEHVTWRVLVTKMEPEKLFAFTWHPYAVKEGVDYSKETPTLVEFHLEKTKTGTLLTLTESGFDKVPGSRRAEAFRMNEGGWTEQMKNIEAYVSKNP
jgi:uncharacterized protein YndB with AHSA1/START domain